MGYRSQIVSGVPMAEKEKVLKALDINEKQFDKINILKDDNRDIEYFIWYADYWKWYDTYDDVIKYEKLIEKINESNDYCHPADLDDQKYAFLLVLGEDGAAVREIGADLASEFGFAIHSTITNIDSLESPIEYDEQWKLRGLWQV